MEDPICPRCKTSHYKNPSLKLMVNVCGHTLCENCVELLFIKGSGNCPECGVSLKRSNFRLQLFEDSTVEKEVDIRKRILKDYNKKEEDFYNLEEYNNYLEEVETTIYNLTNNIDIAETTRRIEQYKKENKESIIKNKMKFNKEVLELDKLIEQEKQYEVHKREALEKQDIELKRKKIIDKEALIDELMFSNNNAKDILNFFTENKNTSKNNEVEENILNKRELSRKTSYFSTGVKIGDNNHLFSRTISRIDEGPLYLYSPPKLIIDGPPFPSWDDLEKMEYLKCIKPETMDEKAGGFLSSLPCMRALQESMYGLYHVFKKSEIT